MQVTTLIRKTVDVKSFIINPLHKPDDTLTIDCILHSVALYIVAHYTHFGQKLTESTNRNFQMCPRKQVRPWIPVLELPPGHRT